MNPGDLIEWVYKSNGKTVDKDEKLYSSSMKQWVPIGGPALVVSVTEDELSWLSEKGLFHARRAMARRAWMIRCVLAAHLGIGKRVSRAGGCSTKTHTMIPGDMIEWVYTSNFSNVDEVVVKNEELYSSTMKSWVPIDIPALLISVTEKEYTWLSEKGLFHASKNDVIIFSFALNGGRAQPRVWITEESDVLG